MTRVARYGRPRIGSLGLPMGKLGMWVFLASEIMFFAGLLDTYIVLRYATPNWPVPSVEFGGIWLSSIMTFILICSSVSMVVALSRIQENDSKGLVKYLLLTILGGGIFLGCQAYEYYHFLHGLHAHPSKSLFWGTFFVCTGFHGFHVTCGVIALVWVLIKALRGQFDAWGCEVVELVGIYWHFVDLVWIVLFTIIYLV